MSAGAVGRSSLVFLYGPPAVGKFTVGSEVSRLTGFGLCHNHLTVDIGRAVFGGSEAARHDLVAGLRLLVATEAARSGVSLVTTFAYSGAVDDEWLRGLVDAVGRHGGRVCFVRLWAPAQVIAEERLGAAHRAPMGKPTDAARFLRRVAERDVFARVRYPGLDVDTTVLGPAEAAGLVVDRFGLRRVGGSGGDS